MNSAAVHKVGSELSAPTGWAGAVVRYAPLFIVAYLGIQCASRIIAPGGLAWDEAEQMVAAQSLELGYSRQPPLYYWLQYAVFQVTGVGKFGLAVLKFANLSAIYLGLWTLALRLGANRETAAISMFGGLLIPTLLWGAQRDLSHLVLTTGITVWTIIAILAALRRPRPFMFVVLGLLFAAGTLAKWNYPLFLVGVGFACLFESRARTRLWLLAIGSYIALLSIPAGWVVAHWDITTAGVGALGIEGGPIYAGWAKLIVSFAAALLSDTLLLLLVLLAVFGAPFGERVASRNWECRFVERVIVFSLLTFFLISLFGGITEVRERWLQPMIILLSTVMAMRVSPKVTPRRQKVYFGITTVVMLVALIMFPINIRYGQNNPASQAIPTEAAAEAMGLYDQVVFVSDMYFAGNLLLVRPELSVITPQIPTVGDTGPAQLAIWWRRDRPVDTAPEKLVDLVTRFAGRAVDLSQPNTLSLPYPPPHEDRRLNVYWAEVTQ